MLVLAQNQYIEILELQRLLNYISNPSENYTRFIREEIQPKIDDLKNKQTNPEQFGMTEEQINNIIEKYEQLVLDILYERYQPFTSEMNILKNKYFPDRKTNIIKDPNQFITENLIQNKIDELLEYANIPNNIIVDMYETEPYWKYYSDYDLDNEAVRRYFLSTPIQYNAEQMIEISIGPEHGELWQFLAHIQGEGPKHGGNRYIAGENVQIGFAMVVVANYDGSESLEYNGQPSWIISQIQSDVMGKMKHIFEFISDPITNWFNNHSNDEIYNFIVNIPNILFIDRNSQWMKLRNEYEKIDISHSDWNPNWNTSYIFANLKLIEEYILQNIKEYKQKYFGNIEDIHLFIQKYKSIINNWPYILLSEIIKIAQQSGIKYLLFNTPENITDQTGGDISSEPARYFYDVVPREIGFKKHNPQDKLPLLRLSEKLDKLGLYKQSDRIMLLI